MAKRIAEAPALLLLGLLALSMPATAAFAQASLMVWPIDPVIKSDRAATALWLENKGEAAAVVQVRVFSWNQGSGTDEFREQSHLLASPPMAQIPPGGRQLVRLTSAQAGRTAAETAYRIVVDEIPTRLPTAPVQEEGAPGKAGVRFQMRYSIPLFVYSGVKPASSSEPADAGLRCTFGERGGQRVVTIVNPGTFHARLVDLKLEHASGSLALPSGQLGYVLAGAQMSWALPAGAIRPEHLSMFVNGSATRATLPRCAIK